MICFCFQAQAVDASLQGGVELQLTQLNLLESGMDDLFTGIQRWGQVTATPQIHKLHPAALPPSPSIPPPPIMLDPKMMGSSARTPPGMVKPSGQLPPPQTTTSSQQQQQSKLVPVSQQQPDGGSVLSKAQAHQEQVPISPQVKHQTTESQVRIASTMHLLPVCCLIK